jgi:hypothetical protein
LPPLQLRLRLLSEVCLGLSDRLVLVQRRGVEAPELLFHLRPNRIIWGVCRLHQIPTEKAFELR